MKKKQSKLSLKKHVVSKFDANAVTGKGPETWTCDCQTRRRDCVDYELTQDGCRTVFC